MQSVSESHLTYEATGKVACKLAEWQGRACPRDGLPLARPGSESGWKRGCNVHVKISLVINQSRFVYMSNPFMMPAGHPSSACGVVALPSDPRSPGIRSDSFSTWYPLVSLVPSRAASVGRALPPSLPSRSCSSSVGVLYD